MVVPRFRVRAGEAVCLHGPSGSGKSTLLNLACGAVSPFAGQVRVAGTALGELSAPRRDRLRAEKIGVIFQMFNLIPYLTGLDNVLLALRFAPARRRACADPRGEALRLTQALGLPDDAMRKGPAAALSTGQQQRVALARAMIGGPPLLIADEPTSALDDRAAKDFLDRLFEQIAATGSALLMASHDRRLAARFDRTEALEDIAAARRGAAA
ncbi:MAG: ATP-binding cassette domain-containing protein [Pseudomonadota bacterium]